MFFLTAFDGYGEKEPVGGLCDIQGYFQSVKDAIEWHGRSDWKHGEVFSVDAERAEITVHAYTDAETGDWIREELTLVEYAHARQLA